MKTKAPKNKSSGYPGVFYSSPKRWKAAIGYNNETRILGYFNDPAEAHLAYRREWESLHGQEYKESSSTSEMKKEKQKIRSSRWRIENPERIKESRRKFEKTRRENNLCTRCAEPSIGRCFLCEYHWLYRVTTKSFGSEKAQENMSELKALLEKQNYTCPYTGRKLVPGVNASIDHIKPKSKYPELWSDLANIQWVDTDANYAKVDMDEADFLSLCREIYEYRINADENYKIIGMLSLGG